MSMRIKPIRDQAFVALALGALILLSVATMADFLFRGAPVTIAVEECPDSRVGWELTCWWKDSERSLFFPSKPEVDRSRVGEMVWGAGDVQLTIWRQPEGCSVEPPEGGGR